MVSAKSRLIQQNWGIFRVRIVSKIRAKAIATTGVAVALLSEIIQAIAYY
ncbi:hypothetical protein LC653_10885 [Nostoc sp. CHAB 5784]|nr:hypothetical protein [Nostoc mirabile]MCC5664408.1 hypothetical protein [Nostoc mirabile CHAB5784]